MLKTSIIIRTYNEEKYLGDLLRALSKQNYRDYEVIVVDSGSTDKTLEIAKEHKVKVIKIESRDFTFGYALNIGCKESEGEYLVFVSAHTLPVNNSWLLNLITSFKDENIAMVYGRHVGHEVSKFSETKDFNRIFKEKSLNSSRALTYANNANSAVRKRLWEKYPFDEYLFGLEDIDWAKRMTEEGFLVRYEPKAAIYHIHTEEWHQVFNRYRREAIAAVKIGLSRPPQVRLEWWWLGLRLIDDLVASFPNWKLKRLEEILRFRYYQWKGSRRGWFKDRDLDLDREKFGLFFPVDNKSVVIKGKDDAKYEETALREIKPGDVLIKVDYVGICRTDLEVLEANLGYYRDGIANYPIVPGHEFAGTIVRIGANNKYRERFKVGQRVVGECILGRGGPEEKKEVGVINYNGAYSTYVVMPGDAIHIIPEEIDSKVAAMTEPLAVVLRAIRRIENRLKEKSCIAVMGAGPIGNLAAQTLSEFGYQVTIFDVNSDRLSLLKGSIETSREIKNLSKFDAIIEATGSKEILEQVIRESRNDATVMLLGFPYGAITYNFEDLVGFEKVFAGSVGGDREDFIKALQLLPKLDMEPFVQKVFSLEEFRQAWDLHLTSQHLKILLKP